MNVKHNNSIGRSAARWCVIGLTAGAGVTGWVWAQETPKDKKPEPAPKEARSAPKPDSTAKSGSSGAPSEKAPEKKPAPSAPAKSPAQTPAVKKSTEPPPSADPEQRFQKIEKQLQEISTAVKELQKGAATPPVASTKTAPPADGEIKLGPEWLQSLTWRSIGPANMSGRSVDLAVVQSDPTTYWVATASGGLVKTTNNGVTFIHQFDRETTVSIGSVCVAPSDPNIVWVGTGENNPRNSVSYGDGVYKSTDGGKTWKHKGLKKSFQVGRILIHPKNPDIVYVGALGRLYGPNEERGLFKTTDGGDTWEKVLYVDDKTGVIDMRMNPSDPQTLLAATWERWRDGFDSHPGDPPPDGYNGYDPMKKWGPGSGLYKTTDGGQHWRRITNGLPTCNLGRIGLDWYRKDPNVVFAIVDSEKIGMGTPPKASTTGYAGLFGEDTDKGARLTRLVENAPAAKAGLLTNDIVQSVADKKVANYEQLTKELSNFKAGDKVKFKILRDNKPLEFTVALDKRPEPPSGGGSGGVYLGVMGEDVEGGARVTSVIADGPAAKGGVQADDIIQSIGDKPVSGYTQLIEEVRTRNVGDKVKLKLLRNEQAKEVELTLIERPASSRGGRRAPTESGAYLGVSGADAEDGVRLTDVTTNSPAAKAGLKTNDLVRAVGAKEVQTYQQLSEEIRRHKPGEKLTLQLRRGDETMNIEVALGERPVPSNTRPSGNMLGGQVENVQDEQGTNSFQYGGVYKSTDGGETWKRINSVNPRPMYFSKIRVDPSNDQFLYVLGVQLYNSTNGGKTFKTEGSRGIHADQHTMWINPRDGRHILIGTDGGFYVTYDRTANWDHLNTMALGQFYHVAISPKQPYYVAGGLQDNGSWMGPTLGLSGSGPVNEDWMSIGGGDGFVCRVDPDDPDLVYGESQDGSMFRRHLRTGERASFRPSRPDGAPPYRFNWNTPFILSHHNSRIFYCGGNYVFRSLNRGSNLQIMSPEITLTKRGSATALAESPRNPDVLYVGTDDGALWLTRDGGKNWTNLTQNVGLPKPQWVSSIEPSRFVEGRAYVAFDCHRLDDDEPRVYVTEDFGKTWKSLRANLPWGSSRVLREDLQNPNLLFLGTEFGAWCSLDRGKLWNKLGTDLPTVAVHEFAIHPGNGEIVAATHGRSLWVLDATALRQIKAEHLADKPALFKPDTVVRWRSEPSRGRTNRRFTGQNPAPGAQLYYSLPKKAEKVALKVFDISGATIRELAPKKEPGLHRLTWDLRAVPVRQTTNVTRAPRAGGEGEAAPRVARGTGAGARSTAAASSSEASGRPGGGGRFGGGDGASVAPSTYRVVLTVDGEDFAQTLRVEADPVVSDAVPADDEPNKDEEEEEEREREMEQPNWRAPDDDQGGAM